MHELSVTESLLRIAVEHAEKANATRVTDLNIVIGDLASMVDESIQFYWDIIAKGTIAEQAKLHFRRIPAELQCNTCSARYRPTEQELICPNCRSVGAKIITGEEFFLESIDVD